tara:strand:+ start:33812 stop:35404 length:1593 start_codon:yes stop_codon:yes gene_type:complete
MSDKKNIDRLFQERFKNFEATPSDAVWNNIEAQLNQKKKKQRVIPIWWRYAGAAALLLLLLTVGNGFFGDTSIDGVTPSNNVVNTEDATRSSASENDKTNSVATDNHTPDNDAAISIETKNISEDITNPSEASAIAESSDKNTSNASLKKASNTIIKSENSIANTNNSEVDAEQNLSKNNNIIQNKAAEIHTNKSKVALENNAGNDSNIAENSETETKSTIQEAASFDKTKADNIIDDIKKNNTTVADTDNNKSDEIAENTEKNKVPSIEDILNETNTIIEEEERLNRWSVTPNAAPVYFNTLRDGSSIDGQFNNNAKTAETNMSYGITASYAVNKKLSIRSGINKVNLGYNTNNVVVYETLSKSSSSSNILGNINTVKTTSKNTNTSSNVALVSAENFESNKAESLVSNSNTSLNQSFAYIEVPLEIQYALSDKKLGINLIGGFSSFFLSGNELFSESGGNRTSIGEATNINNVSYSANFGLGFKYKFTKKLNLNLEPMFKYQINTFENTSGNFTPYFIGVYTGIGFKF